MTLPTFLGIGVARAGTTWLHTLLADHPDVYMPTRRKEIRFFDVNQERGVAWYETFFCSSADAVNYKAIGEISPQYFYCEECPERIAATLPGAKLLVMLRHPVDRAYSHYGVVVQRRNFRGSFEEFVAMRPTVLDKGFYSRYLDRYLRHFAREQIVELVFEDAVRNGSTARQTLSGFLDIPVDGFPSTIGKVNPSTVPRFGSLSNFVVTTGRRLRNTHLEAAVDLGARLGGRRALTKGRALPRLDADLRNHLSERYRAEFDELEGRLGIDVSCWRR
jgi:hypothetical protein